MLRINEISVPLGTPENEIKKAAADAVGIPLSSVKGFEIVKESIDSRKRNNIKMIYST